MTEDEKSDQAYADASDRGAQLLEKLISLGLRSEERRVGKECRL